jgi:uncharacterized protein YtpQ (UPF0354 family)
MLLRALLVTCLAAVLVAGCSGDDSDSGADAPEAVPSAFTEIVRGELVRAGFEIEPATDLELTAQQGPNRVEVDLHEAFERLEDDPGSQDEIVDEVVADTQARAETGIGELSFEDAREDLMPLLKARFQIRRFGFDAAETEQPANLATVYAVDSEDGFTIVTPEDVERWGTTVEEIHEIALDNLLRQTNEEEPLLCEPSGPGGQELCGWASGDGYDATRMIVPELRRQIRAEYGNDEPVVYAVPEEHVYVALPRNALERSNLMRPFRLKLQRDFQQSEDPLSPEIFVEENGKLVVLK